MNENFRKSNIITLTVFFFVMIMILSISLYLVINTYISSSSSFPPTDGFCTPYNIPNIVWLFWEGKISESNRFFLHNLKEKLNSYSIIFLCNTTVYNYINIKKIPRNLNSIQKTNQVDYYRFCLLYLYGGVWMDASTYLSNEQFVKDFIERMEENQSLLGGFNNIYHPNYHIEVGFLISPRFSPFVEKVVEEICESIQIGRKKYIERRIREGIIVKSTGIIKKKGNKVTYEEYLCVYVCILTVLQRNYNNRANLELLKAEDYMYKLHELCDWDATCMSRLWDEVDEVKKYPITKFNHQNRDYISFPKVVVI